MSYLEILARGRGSTDWAQRGPQKKTTEGHYLSSSLNYISLNHYMTLKPNLFILSYPSFANKNTRLMTVSMKTKYGPSKSQSEPTDLPQDCPAIKWHFIFHSPLHLYYFSSCPSSFICSRSAKFCRVRPNRSASAPCAEMSRILRFSVSFDAVFLLPLRCER